jgi:tetratricopeptide (TPR) repeat protein
MIDPYLLRIQKKTMDFWLEYHGTHSWELLDPPEEGDISEVIERLHRDTEASRRRYSTSDLELQDDIFAEAGALEKAERYDEATKLFSELTDDYRFTSRSPISILGPQHHIAILLMQQEKYPEASLKLRKLLSQQLNQEQEAIASIGLAQCLFMQTQKMENPQDAIREQLLNEAEKLTATALQLRENTYPSWHWHYLVPKRLRAQILTTLGSPANIAECRRTMQEIQASIMTDVKDVGNRQRFANINHLANFLLRSREFEEAEKVFEIMYISAL